MPQLGLQDGKRISLRFRRAPSDSYAICRPQFVPHLLACNLLLQQLVRQAHDLLNLIRFFLQQFEAVPSDAASKQCRDELRAALSRRVVQGITTSDIRLQRVLFSNPIAQGHQMVVARSPAIGFVRPWR